MAEFAGIRVYEANMVSNISHDSPCFCGFMAGPAIGAADVGLLVDVDVPWFPRDTRPNEATWWAHIDVDVVKGGSPMWSFPANLRLQGGSARILEQLLEAVQAKSKLTIVHGHGERLMFDRLASLPAHAWNWDDRRAGPSLRDGLARVPGAVAIPNGAGEAEAR